MIRVLSVERRAELREVIACGNPVVVLAAIADSFGGQSTASWTEMVLSLMDRVDDLERGLPVRLPYSFEGQPVLEYDASIWVESAWTPDEFRHWVSQLTSDD